MENKRLALKVQDDQEMATIEIGTMKKITHVFDANKKSELSQEINYDATPRVQSYGLLNLTNFERGCKEKHVAFFTMPHYEMNLKEYLSKLNGVNKIEKVLDVALKLVSIFKYTHCAKRTFNDLKLDNIMIDTQGSMEADPKVYLIDFGFAQKYVKKDGKEHISDKERVECFQGNIIFSSERQMAFHKTCRKDDFISLFYMLIFMLNNKSLWVGGSDPLKGASKMEEVFKSIYDWKKQHDLTSIADIFSREFTFPLKNEHPDHQKHINTFFQNLGLLADDIQKI